MNDETKRGPGRPPKPTTMPVTIVRGYFPADGRKKVLPGTVIDLPLNEAKDIIAKGIAERADPLPS
jgi:hypothetical protein